MVLEYPRRTGHGAPLELRRPERSACPVLLSRRFEGRVSALHWCREWRTRRSSRPCSSRRSHRSRRAIESRTSRPNAISRAWRGIHHLPVRYRVIARPTPVEQAATRPVGVTAAARRGAPGGPMRRGSGASGCPGRTSRGAGRAHGGPCTRPRCSDPGRCRPGQASRRAGSHATGHRAPATVAEPAGDVHDAARLGRPLRPRGDVGPGTGRE